jgi:aminopeptidase-like protein
LEVMTSIIDAFELGEFPNSQTIGEPQLGKCGLHPNVSLKNSVGEDVKTQKILLPVPTVKF